MSVESTPPQLAQLLVWSLLWLLGGMWIVRRAFKLHDNELSLSGAVMGLVAQTWAANLLSRFLPVPEASWLAAGLVFCTGLAFNIGRNWRDLLRFKLDPLQWLAVFFLCYVFTGMSRGLAIFDDYAHLPTTSLIAANGIPPHFPLDPDIPYGYHYFLMLFAAQIARLGGLFPWVALDLARGISFSLGTMLTAIWVRRITQSQVAGFIGALASMFFSGTRWVLLLLPTNLVAALSEGVKLLGSASQTAPNLVEALTVPWVLEGGGTFGFPFAYINGINAADVMAFGPNGIIGSAIGALLLLTFNRWRGWRGFAATAILMAASSLISETGLVISLAAWGLITLYQVIRCRSLRLPKTLWMWLLVIAINLPVAFLQGGAWSEIAGGGLQQLLTGVESESYHTVGFQLVFSPSIVSSHLGVLSLLNPRQLLLALLEIGPVIFALPLVFIYGYKALRCQRWYEAATITGAAITLGMVFIQYSGSEGVRNTSRLYGFIGTASVFCVPLVWIWARRRSENMRAVLAGLGGCLMLGGMVLFGIQMIAIQEPQHSTFITDLDARISSVYWNKLEPGALVFDSKTSRAVSIFGRYTRSSETWFGETDAWKELYKKPSPATLRRAGFSYVYVDYPFWYDIPPQQKLEYQGDCVHLLAEQKEKHGEDFRRLYDIRDCR